MERFLRLSAPVLALIERIRAARLRVPLILIAIALCLCVMLYHLVLPPRGFPTDQLIEIPAGAPVATIGTLLAEKQAIRSPFIFKAYARFTRQDRALTSGPYIFERPIGLASITHRLANGRHGIAPVRVTLTEGMTATDMSAVLAHALPGFDDATFLELARPYEGYLFPDTYFFMPGTTPEEVVARLRARFDAQLLAITDELEASEYPVEELVIMASLLEREAQTEEDMRTIAGILWKRLAIDMPLQVDAVFGYIHGANGYTPMARDLELDSPYNTYRNRGLPPGPIANPGLVALRAAATPIETPYLYYLTGRDGVMQYGRTFDDHRRNRALYLD